MKMKHCPLENTVLKNLAAGDLTTEIHEHIKTCPICLESASVYRWMNHFQQVSRQEKIAEKQLPDADSLWKRAFSYQAPDKELVRKAMKPIRVFQVFSYFIAIIFLLYLVLTNFTGIPGFLNSIPLLGVILTSLSSMVRTLYKSAVFFPMIIGLLSVVIFTFITGFEPKKAENIG